MDYYYIRRDLKNTYILFFRNLVLVKLNFFFIHISLDNLFLR